MKVDIQGLERDPMLRGRVGRLVGAALETIKAAPIRARVTFFDHDAALEKLLLIPLSSFSHASLVVSGVGASLMRRSFAVREGVGNDVCERDGLPGAALRQSRGARRPVRPAGRRAPRALRRLCP